AAWLCLMQHQNLPTRLLDWSGSALAAAFFAVSDEENRGKPGAIWVTSQGILNYHLTGSSLSGPLQTSHLSGTRVVAVTPPRTDRRMAAQRGAFTLHNDPTPLNKIPDAKIALHRIVIPSHAKAHLGVELSATCGIDEAALFPDNLISLSNHLQR